MKLEINFSLDMTETETLTLMEQRQAQNETETEPQTEPEQQMGSNAHAATEPHTEQPTNYTDTEEAVAEKTAKPEFVDNFEEVVNELIKLPASEFMELVDYAKQHSNKFPVYSQFKNVVNADDAYCSALIRITRFWNEDVEKKAFEVFYNSRSKVSKMISVLKAAYSAARDSGGDLQTYYCIAEVVDAYMSTL